MGIDEYPPKRHKSLFRATLFVAKVRLIGVGASVSDMLISRRLKQSANVCSICALVIISAGTMCCVPLNQALFAIIPIQIFANASVVNPFHK